MEIVRKTTLKKLPIVKPIMNKNITFYKYIHYEIKQAGIGYDSAFHFV